jgi:hypothetical protein
MTFLEELRVQRWDDHRFYHRSRVNQSLHLVSACCFLTSYVLIPFNPIAAAIFGWVIAMWPRQIGHFWFEPKGYDDVNDVTFEHKEEVKIGFNLRRKLILFAAWAAVPLVLFLRPSFFGVVSPKNGYVHNLGVMWLWLGFAGLMARTLWLCTTRSAQTGIVWFTKILTDPFHDVMIYWRAPLQLLRGQWLDPMDHARAQRSLSATVSESRH